MGEHGLGFGSRRREIRLIYPGLRVKYRHRWVNPHLDERRVFAFVRPNPNAIQAWTRHGIFAVENEIKHDAPFETTRVLTGLQRLTRQNYFSGGDFFRGIADFRSLSFSSSRAGGSLLDSGLCYARSGRRSGRVELPGGSGS